MHRSDDGLVSFSATEVGNFLACQHLTSLELEVDAGLLTRPAQNDIERRLLEKRGHETGDEALPLVELKALVQSYNEDDCRSTAQLRELLERLRLELAQQRAAPLSRPERAASKPPECLITAWLLAVTPTRFPCRKSSRIMRAAW